MTALGVTLLSATALSFTYLYASNPSNQTLKPNVVYSANPAMTTLISNTSVPEYMQVDPKLETYYIEQTRDALSQYLNVIPEITLQPVVFVVNENFANAEKAYWDQSIQEEYEQGKLTAKEYDIFLKRNEQIKTNTLNTLSALNHDYVNCQFNDETGTSVYSAIFNANTKELIDLVRYDSFNEEKILNIDLQKYEKLGLDFINQHQLGDLQDPQIIESCGNSTVRVICQDSKDPSKKVMLDINPATHTVFGFSTKSYVSLRISED